MDIKTSDCLNHMSEEDVESIVFKYGYDKHEATVDNFSLRIASHNMLGFLCDYWKLKVNLTLSDGDKKVLHFFIKAVSKSNVAKATMVRELKLFQKEIFFYSVLKDKMEVQGLQPWSARFITAFNEVIVFEDLGALQYRSCNKFDRFDTLHTLRALDSLARFHASSIILEENKSKILGRTYVLQKEFDQYLDRGGYVDDDIWFLQCMTGALEAIKAFSQYGTEEYWQKITSKWKDIWTRALSLSNLSTVHRNVICHRDLWNNNILFHYEMVGDTLIPNDCLMVDFQAVRCQPPAGDVMLLLYCNLSPELREQNTNSFLDYYYEQLKIILEHNNICVDNILTKTQFMESAEEQRLWALVVCACLIPQFWIDDELTTKIFTDTVQFEDSLTKDKGSFIKKMMEMNSEYKEKVLEIFDEIVERYCLRE